MTLRTTTAVTSLVLLGCALSSAVLADGSDDSNAIGGYLGASLGISNIHQSFLDTGADTVRTFDDDRTGWKVLMGVRPIDWLGAELEYIDFGDARLGPSPLVAGDASAGKFFGAHGSATAGAGFLVGYLPLPPWFDLFAKAGVARLQTRYSYSGDYPNTYVNCPTACVPLNQFGTAQDNTDTSFAAGVGGQFHFGSFAARLEFERLTATDNPFLVSVGVTWTVP